MIIIIKINYFDNIYIIEHEFLFEKNKVQKIVLKLH
jgi:hypothetical protein